MNEPIYIVDGVRTPFAKSGTTLADYDAVELGKAAVSLLVARSGIEPAKIEEVIIGCVGQPAHAPNIGRVIALRAGIPDSVPAITVHRNCASGFEAAKKFVALSRAKNLSQKLQAVSSFRASDFKPQAALLLGLGDPVSGFNMGQTAENLSRDFNIVREEQDAFAMRSHQRATAG